ncbi:MULTISPECIES: manganese efflux pump MntP [Caproicibacterium]|uniref:Putative manganese efflux pump MntP n=1 Tax=Caproicibacterium argilliputei TaxID=3030016 RepID=A0AA97H237_9FIRM|nr:manganese efflux pump MntP family protein [Caproicibacterium argilliputei]WOC33181.1 manganese efflux pump MntP family protein [Caproicibacterium argilliputei]
MDGFALVSIAVGLSMDAFAVSLANGAVTCRVRPAFALKLAAVFGGFQAAMPMLGWLIGKAGAGFINAVDHWVALILLSFIGVQMLLEARKAPDCGCLQEDLPLKTLLTLAVATSIDALATGIILPNAVGAASLQQMLLSVGIIGAVTFVLCLGGVFLGKKCGDLLRAKAQIVGGLVLIAIGVKIFIEHMWFS